MKRFVKRNIVFTVMGILLIGLTACGGGGKYADFKDVANEMTAMMNDVCDTIENADDAKAVAKGIVQYAEGMKKLGPKMQAMDKKYPALKNTAEMPQELKGEMEKINNAMARFQKASAKFAQYAADADVQAAMKKLQDVKF